MPKVIFKFDKDKDLYNIWNTCNSKNSFGHNFKEKVGKKTLQICEGKSFEEIKDKLEKNYESIYNSKLIELTVKFFNEAWSKIEGEYFKRLEKIMKKEFCCKKVTAFLTIAPKCPYNPDPKNASFFINFFSGVPNAVKTCAHELMHIQFHNTYWLEVEKEIGKEKTADLKEALTVILNIEFKDIIVAFDEGYSIHKDLRNFIEKSWRKNKDFKKLIEDCVSYLK